MTSQSILEADRKKNIDTLYIAIEKALGEEFHCLLDEYNKLEVALRRISEMKTENIEQLQAVAKKALGKDPAIH